MPSALCSRVTNVEEVVRMLRLGLVTDFFFPTGDIGTTKGALSNGTEGEAF